LYSLCRPRELGFAVDPESGNAEKVKVISDYEAKHASDKWGTSKPMEGLVEHALGIREVLQGTGWAVNGHEASADPYRTVV